MFGGRIESLMVLPAGVTLTATNGAGGPTLVTLTAGTYTATSLVVHVVAALNAQRPTGWTGSVSIGSNGTGRVTLAGTGTWSITWTSTTLRDALGFAANIVAVAVAQTGTVCARGLWLPDAPMQLESDPARAPIVSDLRTTQSPTGKAYAMAGNTFFRHRNVRWSHVPQNRVHEAKAQFVGNTWETWFRQSQIGGLVAWLSPGSPFEMYDHNETKLGSDYGVVAWQISPAINSIEPVRASGDWVGYWTISINQIISAG